MGNYNSYNKELNDDKKAKADKEYAALIKETYKNTEQLLFSALNYSDHTTFIELASLKRGYDFKALKDIEDNNGNTLLQMACRRPRIEIIKFLLESNCDVNKPGNRLDKFTPLMELCNYKYEKKAIFDLLMSYKPDVNIPDIKGIIAIGYAHTSEHLYYISQLLPHSAIYLKSNMLYKMIFHKISNNEIINALIDQGGNIEYIGSDDKSIFCTDLVGFYPDMYNKISQRVEFIPFISKLHPTYYNMNIISHAFIYLCNEKTTKLDAIKILYKTGLVDINAIIDNSSALLNSIKHNHIGVVSYLLEEKADYKINAFLTACEHNCLKIAELLLDYNIDINEQNSSGNTGLMIALQQKNYELILMILSSKHMVLYDINAQNNNKETTLTLATLMNNDLIINAIKGIIHKNIAIGVMEEPPKYE